MKAITSIPDDLIVACSLSRVIENVKVAQSAP
jgi:hypothetical protein